MTRARRVDLAILVLLFVPWAVSTLLTGPLVPGRLPGAAVVGIGLLGHLPVLARRDAPVLALAVALVGAGLTAAAGGPVLGLVLAVLVGTLARSAGPGAALAATAGTAAAAGALATASGTPVLAPLGAVVVGGVAGAVRRHVVVGRARRRAAEDTAQRAAAAEAERRTVAATLHGTVRGHLEDTVTRAENLDPDGPPEAFAAVADSARAALGALREMLALLRDPPVQEASARAAPAPALDPLTPTALAVLALVLGLPGVTPPEQAAVLALPGTVAGVVALVLQLGATGFRRRAPAAALVVATLASASTVVGAGGGGQLAAVVAWAVLAYSTVVYATPRRAVGAVVLSVGVVLVVSLAAVGFGVLPEASAGGTVGAMISTLVTTAVVVGAGLLGRSERIARDAAAAADRAALAADTRRRERLRLARDLHDGIAHHVSGMAVQAAAARSVGAGRPDLLADAVVHLRATGRRTLQGLPSLFEALGHDDDLRSALDDLAAPLRASGGEVRIEVDDGTEPVSTVVEVVREALTNVAKHAGPTGVTVEVRAAGPATEVEVRDDGPVPGHRPPPAGGHGLVGMRERVADGAIEAGPCGAGWRVRVRLPAEGAGREPINRRE
ncbi:sensor histidine kinase [Actinomycetospora termitidis]|uniref:histidine kinase n=1 Tax=Actinomycetospora termitidis TaxID=3053470 RepID=A0ABT7MH46_9PSEU|nr:histidine kinase [Actinomycetospora sp. Odt1-22]MDL5160013.1 histidine kinase [Actinomycetospora sp. Odt1-22]